MSAQNIEMHLSVKAAKTVAKYFCEISYFIHTCMHAYILFCNTGALMSYLLYQLQIKMCNQLPALLQFASLFIFLKCNSILFKAVGNLTAIYSGIKAEKIYDKKKCAVLWSLGYQMEFPYKRKRSIISTITGSSEGLAQPMLCRAKSVSGPFWEVVWIQSHPSSHTNTKPEEY